MLVRTLAKVLRLERCEPPMLVFSGEWLSHSYYWMRIAAEGQAPGAVLDLKRDASDWPTT